jgi:nucleoside-diphosphate-sugar epimerase
MAESDRYDRFYFANAPMMKRTEEIPATISSVSQLEDLLSTPTQPAIDAVRRLEGDFIILGAAGKMGPSLARMIRRAADDSHKRCRVIAVSRFSSRDSELIFHEHGIETIKADLLDQRQLDALPDAPNIVYMTGMKFGSTGEEALTWAMNCYLPGMICNKYRHSRIVAFSTGNVYGLTSVSGGGSGETDRLDPLGDYAMSCLGRERMFEHFSRALNIPISIIRLNYAVEMRYGVLHDLATRVNNGQPIDLSMGHANVIWQADANAMSIAAFAHTANPPCILNVAGPEIFSVREVAQQFGQLLGKPPKVTGEETPTALLNNPNRAIGLFGPPRVSLDQLIHWTADWIKQGGESLNKPTHFEARDGKF